MHPEIVGHVKHFVSREVGLKEEKLTLETRLAQDLGMDGSVAGEVMEAFFRAFDVDASDFQFDKHFESDDGLMPWTPLVWMWNWLTEQSLVPITINDLVESAQAHRWMMKLCRRCGYDIRASRGRCPECGEQIMN